MLIVAHLNLFLKISEIATIIIPHFQEDNLDREVYLPAQNRTANKMAPEFGTLASGFKFSKLLASQDVSNLQTFKT